MNNKNKHTYIDIVKFYEHEIRSHEESIAELRKMLDQLESLNSFKEMDYSCGAIPDPNISGRKEDGK